MTRQLIAFLIITVFGLAMSYMMGGDQAFADTSLVTPIDGNDTTIPVATTSGFPSGGGVVQIDNEIISYTGVTATTFTGVTRGRRDSEPVSHANGTAVYNEPAGLVESVVSFNILETVASDGVLIGLARTVTQVPGMLASWLWKIIMLDFAFLEGPLSYVRVMLQVFAAGLVLSFVGFVLRRNTS